MVRQPPSERPLDPASPPSFDVPPPTRAGPAPLAWLILAICLALFLSVGLIVQSTDVGFGVWFTEVIIILGTAWAILRASGREPARFTRLSEAHPGPMLFGFLLGAANYIAVVIPLQFLTTSLAPRSWVIDESKIFAQPSSLELFAVITGVGIAAPICEEFLFRGTLQHSLSVSSGHRVRPVLLAAAVFSAFHFDAVGFLPRFELGILFGLLFIRFDSLWPGICAHAANNLVPTLIYFLTAGGPQSDAQPSVRDVLSLATLGLAVLLFLLWLGGVIRAWRPRRADPTAALANRPHTPIGRAVFPWVALGLAALFAFFGVRSLRTWRGQYHRPPRPHVYKM